MTRPSVVITGASTGIGAACARYLVERGAHVFAGVRRAVDGEALAARTPEGLTPLLIDVTDEASIAGARNAVTSAVGDEGLQGLVNNAGIVVNGPLELVPLDELRRQFEVNVFGQVAVTQAFVPLLRQASGRVVNMSSISGRVTGPLLAPYSMSKFALEAFSDGLRRELEPWGIDVACVEPGAIATPIWEKALDGPESQDENLPDGARELYGARIDALRKFARTASEKAVPAERVAKVVHHALFSRRPKTRYLVGPDARVQAIISRVLPDRWLDAFFRRLF